MASSSCALRVTYTTLLSNPASPQFLDPCFLLPTNHEITSKAAVTLSHVAPPGLYLRYFLTATLKPMTRCTSYPHFTDMECAAQRDEVTDPNVRWGSVLPSGSGFRACSPASQASHLFIGGRCQHLEITMSKFKNPEPTPCPLFPVSSRLLTFVDGRNLKPWHSCKSRRLPSSPPHTKFID